MVPPTMQGVPSVAHRRRSARAAAGIIRRRLPHGRGARPALPRDRAAWGSPFAPSLGSPRVVGREPMEEFIRGLPQVEVHLHIEGTLEPEMMFRLAERNGLSLPFAPVE